MTMNRLRVALAQINPTVGDIPGNVARIRESIETARSRGADVVVFPELAITGYPPEDLVLRPDFVNANLRALEEVAAAARGIVAVVGFVDRGTDLHNAAAVVHDGRVAGVYRKQRLPNYGVFDELRYFRPGSAELLVEIAGVRVGVTICEDLWDPDGPVAPLARAGAEVVLNLSASPFHRGKWRLRRSVAGTRASEHGVSIVYVNAVGGQDELVFDGGSMVVGARGEMLAEAEPFAEDVLVHDLDLTAIRRARRADIDDPCRAVGQPDSVDRVVVPTAGAGDRPSVVARGPVVHDDLAETYRALVVGTRDYVRKNGFRHVVLGLSGGIDSALVAAIAVDALGAEAVTGVSMPSRYSSEGSRTDARELADALGIRLLTLPIEAGFSALLETLAPVFGDRPHDLTEENLQARIRGMLLMALSNKFGWLVLTTGNKSEAATGYSTLYGDSAGGFAPIKDVYKTLVYALARWRNAAGAAPIIPEAILTKPPSAELRPGQRDDDSLPPYDVLDPILEGYIEKGLGIRALVESGFDAEVVRRVIALVDASEYKRRQAPPGIKVTTVAFGKDRRLPLTSRYREADP
jgi:NAD+ synthase (glutamine-hydrolysing)